VSAPVSRQEASDAATPLGWRLVLGALVTRVPVGSLAEGAGVAQRLVAAAGEDADGHVRVDLRPEAVVLTVQSRRHISATAEDLAVMRRISAEITDAGLRTEPGVGDGGRSVQLLELAIDAMDIPAIRPFWKAVLGYRDEVGKTGPSDALIDPLGHGPAVWFQQMDVPRPQRNRIHFDVSVPHDEAPQRIRAALAAGGTVVYDAEAPAFWVLADAEGNEACVTTWQGRD
jgi:4a-hydroxytetrahydrobiopterin dehydratase